MLTGRNVETGGGECALKGKYLNDYNDLSHERLRLDAVSILCVM